jgi:glycogen(starch) synthase
MRILVLTSLYPPHHLGGYEIACRSTVRGLRHRGHDVSVLASRYRVDGVADDEEAERSLRLFWEAGKWNRPGLRGAVQATRNDIATLRRALTRFRPDLVWAWHMAGISKSLLSECAARGLPMVFAVHDLWPLYDLKPDPWLRWTRGWRFPVGRGLGTWLGLPARALDIRAAARASYNSDWTREQVVRSGVLGDGPVIYPGVDLSLFGNAPGPQRPIRRFLVVGRIEPRKAPAVVVEALAQLRGAGIEDATLTVMGSSERNHLKELEALAQRLRVEDAVTFRRAVPYERMPGVYAEHDAVIHAAVWDEPFGLTIVEAMACRRPVIASPTGGANEVVSDANALTFSPGDAEACAKRMWQLATDPTLSPRLVAEGEKTAKRFSQETSTRAHEEHLRSVLASPA